MSWNREVVESWSFCLSGCHFCAHNHTHISPNRKPQQKENANNTTEQNTPERDECNWSEYHHPWHHNPLPVSYNNPARHNTIRCYKNNPYSQNKVWRVTLVCAAPWVWRGRRRIRSWDENRVRVGRIWGWRLRNRSIPTSCCWVCLWALRKELRETKR